MAYSRVRIKMCGMTRHEDIAHAVALGVDAVGLIFYERSQRCVSIEKARRLLESLPVFVDVIAVVVNAERSFVERIICDLPIHCLQFHGDESPECCEQFNKPYIRALPALSTEAITKEASRFQSAKAILLDTPSINQGGTGVAFDWRVVPRLAKPLVLAGGLNAENVRNAAMACSPYAVDVCSGIEASPGVKDHAKMTRFVQALRDTMTPN